MKIARCALANLDVLIRLEISVVMVTEERVNNIANVAGECVSD